MIKRKNIISKILFATLVCIIAAGCGGGSATTSPTDPIPVPVAPAPTAATLVFPAKDALCTQGTITGNQSTVTLKWNAATNTNSYDVVVKNLVTAVSKTYSTTGLQQDVLLDTSTPYSWYVISKSTASTSTATSDVWKFYNAGPGVVSYAPYPAEIVSPGQKESTTATAGQVTLKWNGADVDNDIASYDVYFGTATTPALFKGGITTNMLSVPVTSATTYYWKIITTDSKGNTSDSGVYQFTVK